MRNNYVQFCSCLVAMAAFFLNVSFTVSSSQSARAAAAIAQPVTVEYKELILQIYQTNAKNHADIRATIEDGGGVFFKGYCATQAIYLYVVNTDVNPEYKFLDKLTLKGYSYLIKEGSTIEQVQAACGMDATSDNHSTETE